MINFCQRQAHLRLGHCVFSLSPHACQVTPNGQLPRSASFSVPRKFQHSEIIPPSRRHRHERHDRSRIYGNVQFHHVMGSGIERHRRSRRLRPNGYLAIFMASIHKKAPSRPLVPMVSHVITPKQRLVSSSQQGLGRSPGPVATCNAGETECDMSDDHFARCVADRRRSARPVLE